MFAEFINKYVTRIVAFLLVPVLLPLSGSLVILAKNVLGLNLSAGAVTGFVVSVVAGVALVGFKWLEGRKEWEQLETFGTTVLAARSTTGQAEVDRLDPELEARGADNPKTIPADVGDAGHSGIPGV